MKYAIVAISQAFGAFSNVGKLATLLAYPFTKRTTWREAYEQDFNRWRYHGACINGCFRWEAGSAATSRIPTPRVVALEQEVVVLKQQVGDLSTKNMQLETGLSGNQQEIADLEALVTSIHGPTLPSTEPPVIPPMPEGGYAVYDANEAFVGTTFSGSDVRITFDQYPGIYFSMPAFEGSLPNWYEGTWQLLFFPDSNDCSGQPYIASWDRVNALAGASLLNPTPSVNTNHGPIVQKYGSTTSYYIADPNNEAEARAGTGNDSYSSLGNCVPSDLRQQFEFKDRKVLSPAQEVTIDITYPLQVIFD